MKVIIRLCIFVIISFILSSICYGQVEKTKPSFNYLSGTHYRIFGANGLTKFDYDLIDGVPLNSPLLLQGSLSLEGIRYLNNGLFIAPSLGVFYTTQKNNVMMNGMDWYRYQMGLETLFYLKTGIGMGFAKLLNPQKLLRSQVKFGGLLTKNYRLKRFDPQTLDYNRTVTEAKIHPYISLHSSLGFVLSNKDIIELGVYYNLSLSTIYRGEYNTILTDATYTSRNNDIGISLGYTLSRAEKRLSKQISHSAYSEYRKMRRNLKQSSILLELSSGYFYPLNKVNDPDGIIYNMSDGNLGFRAELELGINIQQFWEMGLHLGNYYSGYSIRPDGINIVRSRAANDFIALAFNLGRGYRIKLKNDLNLITVSGGLSANLNLSPGGYYRTRNYSDRGEDAILSSEPTINYVYYPTVYGNINKDFRITDRMFLTMNYRYNHGFVPTQTQDYNVEILGSGENRQFTGKITGTSHSYELGLKFLLDKKIREEKAKFEIQNYSLSDRVFSNKVNKARNPLRLKLAIAAFAPQTIANDPEGLFQNSSYTNRSIRIDLEWDVRKNQFWELGIQKSKLRPSYKLNSAVETTIANGGLPPFSTWELNIGRGYRFSISDRVKGLSISGGITTTFIVNPASKWNSSSFQIENRDAVIESTVDTKNSVSPSAYISLYKDWKLTDRLYLNTGYRYNQGLITMSEHHMDLRLDNPYERRLFTSEVKGTSQSIELGLKYHLRKKNHLKDGGNKVSAMEDSLDKIHKSKNKIKSKERRKKSRRQKEGAKAFAKSHSVEIVTGIFFPLNISTDPDNFIQNSSFGTASFRFDVELSASKHQFWDIGASLLEYSKEYRINEPTIFPRAGRVDNRFRSVAIHVGRGYRLYLNNGYNLFSVSAGVTGNFILDPQEFNYDRIIGPNDLNLQTVAATQSRITPSVYFNINKDIKLMDRLSVSLNYRYNYGRTSIYDMQLTLLSDNQSTIRKYSNSINNTSQLYEFGLKFSF